ncbi:MAG: hypothetical protein WC539_08510, partial [Nitrospirota bacterium]
NADLIQCTLSYSTSKVRLDSFLEAYQSADALWYAEVPSYGYQVFCIGVRSKIFLLGLAALAAVARNDSVIS